ncbi:MAG: hypothetical protein K2H64_02525, partial [Desulfovibrio sp.]|nr:hypothetical protein [Desulfovibrio sp.]
FGFVCMLILVGLWLGELQFAENGNAYLRELFSQAWSLRFPLPPYWFLPLVIAVFGAMPWILIIFGVSWVRVLKTSPQTIGDSRRINGSALVWISLVLAACLPFFTGRFHLVATLIICIETALLGKAFVILPPAGNRLFFFLAPLFLVAVGVLILLVSFGATQAPLLGLLPFKPTPVITDALLNLDFLPIIGGVVLLGGILGFAFSRWYKKNGGLVYALLFVIVLTQPFLLGLSPEIGALTNSPLMTLKQVEEKYAARQIAAPVAPEQKAPAVIPPETPETVAPAPAEVVSPARPVAPAVEPAPPAAEPVIPDVSGALAPKSSTPEQNSAEPNAAPAIPESAPALPEGAPADVVAPRLDATNLPAIPETKPAIPQAPETNAVPKKEIIEEIIIVEPDGKEAEELAKDLAKEIEKEAAPAPEAPAQTPEAPAQ